MAKYYVRQEKGWHFVGQAEMALLANESSNGMSSETRHISKKMKLKNSVAPTACIFSEWTTYISW